MTSDTEALLHLYARHSAEMAHRLRGMFAFAIWDERQRGLLLVPGPGMEAAIVWYQPNGRRHRRFQLGAVGQDATPGTMLWVSMVDAALLLVGGLYYFRRMERTFADVS